MNMRNKLLALALGSVLVCSLPVAAQEPPQLFGAGALPGQIDRYSSDLRDYASAVRRDAFIMAQMVAASGQLHDEFQKHVSIEKAHELVEAAARRAAENPPAAAVVQTDISQALDLLDHARENASSADMPDLQRLVLLKTNDVQRIVLREMEGVRRQKLLLRDMIGKLNAANDQLDVASSEAIASTLDFFKAGAK